MATLFKWTMGLVVLVLVLGTYDYLMTSPAERQARAAKYQAARDAKAAEEDAAAKRCREDLDCFVAPVKLDAMAACRGAVAGLAKYEHEWTSGGMTPAFSDYRWGKRDAGVVEFVGDQIRFKDSAGQWQRHRYFCEYDVPGGKVANATADPY